VSTQSGTAGSASEGSENLRALRAEHAGDTGHVLLKTRVLLQFRATGSARAMTERWSGTQSALPMSSSRCLPRLEVGESVIHTQYQDKPILARVAEFRRSHGTAAMCWSCTVLAAGVIFSQMVRLYVNMVDDDLLKAARTNPPVDRLMREGSGASKPRRRRLRPSG